MNKANLITDAETLQSDTTGQVLNGTAEVTEQPVTTLPVDSEAETVVESKSSESFFEVVRKYASVSDLLRMFGALAVATAMGVFLLEGVEVVNDLYRYLTMLGLTSALTAAGLMMSIVLKEQRGSRVFISLGMLSVPVNFTVFGALVYSKSPLDSMGANYPNFAHWTASASDITLALIGGVAVLLPVVWLGYSVLARSARSWLSAALIFGSAVLIIPVRQELWAALIALGSSAAIWWVCQRNSKDSLALKTAEGKFGIALLFVAPIIVVVRSLFLYEVTGVLLMTLAGGFYFYARQLTAQRNDVGLLSNVFMIMAAIASVLISGSATDVLTHYVGGDLPPVLGVLLLLVLSFDMYRVSSNTDLANQISMAMVGVAAFALVFIALTTGSAAITMLNSIILLAVAAVGYVSKRNAMAVISALGAASILVFNVEVLWAAVAQTGWWGIAIGGAVAIVAGSMLDRAGTVVEARG